MLTKKTSKFSKKLKQSDDQIRETEVNISKITSQFNKVLNFKIITSLGDVPDSKAFFICGLKNKNEVFIYGGADINKQDVSHEVFFYDVKDNYWINLCNISHIKQFLGSCSNLLGHTFEYFNHYGIGKIFVFGGFNGIEYSNKAFLVDYESFECFEPIDYINVEVPSGRCYHTSNYYTKTQSIYIFGGWDGNPFNLQMETFNILWKFSRIKNLYIWEKVKPFSSYPSDRLVNKRGHSSNLINDSIYIFGGLEGFNKFSNNMIVIDLLENTFSTVSLLNQLCEPRAFHASYVLNNTNIIISGGMSYYERVLSDLFLININTLEMVKVEIENMELMKYGHKITRGYNKKSLILLGGFRNVSELEKFYINDSVNEPFYMNSFSRMIVLDLEYELD